ncbi:hypothetical protein [Streptomyces sp. NPDC000983]
MDLLADTVAPMAAKSWYVALFVGRSFVRRAIGQPVRDWSKTEVTISHIA